MRIVHIEKYLTTDGALAGGVGQYVRTLSDALGQRGHATLAFGCVPSGGRADMPQWKDFNATQNPLALLKMMHNPTAAAKLDVWLQRHRVDVAHLHNVYHHLTPSILPVLANRGVGMVMTCHDLRQLGAEWRFWRWPVQPMDFDGIDDHYARAARQHCAGPGGAGLAIKTATDRLLRRYERWIGRYLCPTDMMAGELRRRGVAEKRIVRVRNPVARIEPAQCPPRSDVLLYVGRLAVEKSPELLLPLARRLPGAKVQVAGEGPMREPLGVAATRGRIWNLELLGHLGPEELSRAYARASAVVLTSRCTENSPAVLLEAMAAGQCVIAPDQPAIREWITDGETGRLYPTGDVDAFVAAAREALADRRQRTRLGQAAAERIAAMHDTQAIVETTEAAYEAARQIARRRCESP